MAIEEQRQQVERTIELKMADGKMLIQPSMKMSKKEVMARIILSIFWTIRKRSMDELDEFMAFMNATYAAVKESNRQKEALRRVLEMRNQDDSL